jgi:hypothetical protein
VADSLVAAGDGVSYSCGSCDRVLEYGNIVMPPESGAAPVGEDVDAYILITENALPIHTSFFHIPSNYGNPNLSVSLML